MKCTKTECASDCGLFTCDEYSGLAAAVFSARGGAAEF